MHYIYKIIAIDFGFIFIKFWVFFIIKIIPKYKIVKLSYWEMWYNIWRVENFNARYKVYDAIYLESWNISKFCESSLKGMCSQFDVFPKSWGSRASFVFSVGQKSC